MPFLEEYKVLSIEQMISKFTLGHNGDPALNSADIMALFNHDVSSEKSTARKLLNIGINQPDRFLRSSDERKAAAQLSQQMQNIYADITLS